MAAERKIVVLHSTRAPSAGVTTYAVHMAATAGDGVIPVLFTWPRAFFGRYDLFHLHWPEGLAGTGRGAKGIATTTLTRLLIARLRRTRIPVVYTVHNHEPHEGGFSRPLRSVYEGFESLTVREIHLVPEPDRGGGAATSIPHGGYVEAFAQHPRAIATPGRALFFGIMRPYKGIEELLEAFGGVRYTGAQLRLVGQPRDPALKRAIVEAAAVDPRISSRFGFVPDRELVAEVTKAQLVVLPYRTLHSSGAALVALSLGRPVLVPDTVTTRALRDEVGAEWVHVFPGALTTELLEQALDGTNVPPAVPPKLSARTRERVRAAHATVYRQLIPAAPNDETVFAWLEGQDDNIGDSALRRGYADALRVRGPLVVFAGRATESYLEGLGLQPGDRVVGDLGAWLHAAVAAARVGPATLAINAGEFSFSGTYVLRVLRILPALWRFRRAGGNVIWLGAAVPGIRRGVTWMFRRLFDMSDLVRWRDSETSSVFEAAQPMPDWALALDAEGASGVRPALGVSLRFDRTYPSVAWLTAVRELAQRLELEVVAVAQVRRDSDRARRLAEDLGGRAVVFGEVSNAVQERIVRAEYSRMRVMLSDRLHALLIAQTEGAVPLAWVEAATVKLSRHFDSLGMGWASARAGERIDRIRSLDESALVPLERLSAAALADARSELARLQALIAGDQWCRAGGSASAEAP